MLVICRWQLCLQWHLWVLLCWIYAYVMTIHTKCNQNNFFLVSFVFFFIFKHCVWFGLTLQILKITTIYHWFDWKPCLILQIFSIKFFTFQKHLFISYTDRLIIENRSFWNHLIFVKDFFNIFNMLKRKFRSDFSIGWAFVLFCVDLSKKNCKLINI